MLIDLLAFLSLSPQQQVISSGAIILTLIVGVIFFSIWLLKRNRN